MSTGAAPAKALREATHELNNLCSTIVGFASLAEQLEPQHAEIAAYLAEIRHAADAVAAVARQLREVSSQLEAAAS